MAIPKRHARIPGTYFVTSRTWESRRLFVPEAVCSIFVETLLYYRKQGTYKLHAFVLMPDHFHALVTPAPSITLERAVQFIKGGSARRIGKEVNFQFPVWQRGFSDHRIRDVKDCQIHLDYIQQNPVKKKLVADRTDYPWSSASGRFQLDELPQGLKPDYVLVHTWHD